VASIRAGTPTSRGAAALIRLRLAHDAAAIANAASSSGSQAALVDLCELSVDVETLLDQFDLTDGRRFLGGPLLDLRLPLLEVGPAPCRHLRRPQRRQIGGDRGRFGSPLASIRRGSRSTPRHRCLTGVCNVTNPNAAFGMFTVAGSVANPHGFDEGMITAILNTNGGIIPDNCQG
jgi:hypothetical protein